MHSKLIILDRDGVINLDRVNFVRTPDEWQPIPGSREAIALLNQAGFTIGVATNQSGIARGIYDLNALDAVHQKMQHYLAEAGAHIDAIQFCPHVPEAHCHCRKPKPGMLETLIKQFNADPAHTWFIGDALRDMEAGKLAGCRTALVLTGQGEMTLKKHAGQLADVAVFADLADCVASLLEDCSLRQVPKVDYAPR